MVEKERFAKFWAAYPRKIARKKALAIWLRDKPPLDEVLAKVEEYKLTEQWRKDSGAFIPHPATFLNQERYYDELDISFGEDFVKEKLWHETWTGIVAKGEENGLKEEDFEDPQDFKRAVFKKCKPELKVA